jgi:hypothetical protein
MSGLQVISAMLFGVTCGLIICGVAHIGGPVR